MERNVNPWTGKTKPAKTSGLFNEILYKHYPQFQQQTISNPYLSLIPLIESQTNKKDVSDYRQVFNLKSKIAKMDEITRWLQKMNQTQNNRSSGQQIPINSSFVYIPVHSYDTFIQILRDCSAVTKQPILKEQVVTDLKKQIGEMQKILKLNAVLIDNVL